LSGNFKGEIVLPGELPTDIGQRVRVHRYIQKCGSQPSFLWALMESYYAVNPCREFPSTSDKILHTFRRSPRQNSWGIVPERGAILSLKWCRVRSAVVLYLFNFYTLKLVSNAAFKAFEIVIIT